MAGKTYGVGIVGIGSVARTHALAINELPNARLIGGCCRTQRKGREREVLQLVAEGLRTKEIANRLHISPKTAETHRQQVMNKLNIHSVADLTKFAVREGLTSLET